MIRLLLFLGLALVAILPSMAIAAIGVRREGKPVTVTSARDWVRAKWYRAVPLITLNLVIFVALWWLIDTALETALS